MRDINFLMEKKSLHLGAGTVLGSSATNASRALLRPSFIAHVCHPVPTAPCRLNCCDTAARVLRRLLLLLVFVVVVVAVAVVCRSVDVVACLVLSSTCAQ